MAFYDLGGIIPTRVGSIRSAATRCSARRDHPHACGEHTSEERQEVAARGSSPRVWGACPSSVYCAQGHRIIPTRVGSIIMPEAPISSERDHPHACGEHFPRHRVPLEAHGSSPRVWGALGLPEKGFVPRGIIPTRVGSMATPSDAGTASRDHPHACGEHCCADAADELAPGSSPRVWGASR